jgi:phosphate transport system protein
MSETRRTSREYEQELQQVRRKLVVMAERVQQMTLRSVNALVERNSQLAAEVILDDREVNREELELDELCMLVLARRQPMASDLRFVATAMKMVTDVERIGDLAVNIAERAISLNGAPPLRPYADIPRMADIVSEMLNNAITAFLDGDAKLAETVIERDDVVDELYHKVFRDVLELMTRNPETVRRGIDVQSVAKFLERMADHITNIAELVIYMIRGKDVRHLGKRG